MLTMFVFVGHVKIPRWYSVMCVQIVQSFAIFLHDCLPAFLNAIFLYFLFLFGANAFFKWCNHQISGAIIFCYFFLSIFCISDIYLAQLFVCLIVCFFAFWHCIYICLIASFFAMLLCTACLFFFAKCSSLHLFACLQVLAGATCSSVAGFLPLCLAFRFVWG